MGMVIAISWDDVRRGLWREISSLQRLWVNAWKSKIQVSFVTPRGVRALEPNLRSCGGLVIPSVCVIDPAAFVQALKADSEATGTVFSFNNPVVGIEADRTSYLVTTDRKTIRAACLINAAGLYADDIASLALHNKKYTIYPLRGSITRFSLPPTKALLGVWSIRRYLVKPQARAYISVPARTDNYS
jgi:glycerol-3-phosphate dehydrogenase